MEMIYDLFNYFQNWFLIDCYLSSLIIFLQNLTSFFISLITFLKVFIVDKSNKGDLNYFVELLNCFLLFQSLF